MEVASSSFSDLLSPLPVATDEEASPDLSLELPDLLLDRLSVWDFPMIVR